MKKLYLSLLNYSQAFAVQKLAEALEKKGAKLLHWKGTTLITIREDERKETKTQSFKDKHPDFETPWVSWDGWQINFELNGYRYELFGDDNPFFPVYIGRKPLGSKKPMVVDEFKDFNFEYGDLDYRDNPEGENTEEIVKAILAYKGE